MTYVRGETVYVTSVAQHGVVVSSRLQFTARRQGERLYVIDTETGERITCAASEVEGGEAKDKAKVKVGNQPYQHPSTQAVLQHFSYEHLPWDSKHRNVSERFAMLAYDMAVDLEGPELTVGLRKLLEAKDCMVRAALPTET